MNARNWFVMCATAMVAMGLSACGASGTDSGSTTEVPVGQTYSYVIDTDGDGRSDGEENDQCGPLAVLLNNVYPGATEVCDEVDNDCDRLTDEDTNGNVRDSDNDGKVDMCDDDDDNDGDPDAQDCQPLNALVKHHATEVCGDNADTDCNGTENEESAVGCTMFFSDVDDDTYGVGTAKCLCEPLQSFKATRAGDCNDGLASVNPGSPEICDGVDNDCDAQTDEGFADRDADAMADCSDLDDDNDGRADMSDNCPNDANADQADVDRDTVGDVCDSDDDNDQVGDLVDNCPLTPNSDQRDFDLDREGDACDTDDDGDVVPDTTDNCPTVRNLDQLNFDRDALGDACDDDDDADSVLDNVDNCLLVANSDQRNSDNTPDGGDACDADDDNDGVVDTTDNCQFTANPGQENANGNAFGDACDTDDDGDGVVDASDNCPTVSNANQANFDQDLLGDVCDLDDDNDGSVDADDCNDFDRNVYPSVRNDECNNVDDDCDGVTDENPTIATGRFYSVDADGDGYGDPRFAPLVLCLPISPYTALLSNDCQGDSNPNVNPGTREICGNGVDEDCSGADTVCGAAEVNCGNGQDDDQDGRVDCADSDCTGVGNCPGQQVCNPVCGAGQSCINGACVNNVCQVDANCPSGQRCQANTCVPMACNCQIGQVCDATGACVIPPNDSVLNVTWVKSNDVPGTATRLMISAICWNTSGAAVVSWVDNPASPNAVTVPVGAATVDMNVHVPNLRNCRVNVASYNAQNTIGWWAVRDSDLKKSGTLSYRYNALSVSNTGVATNGQGGGDFVFAPFTDSDGDNRPDSTESAAARLNADL